MPEDEGSTIQGQMQPVDVMGAFQNMPPPLDLVLPGMIAGTVGSIVAQGGAGKSWMALETAIAVAGGPDILELGIPAFGRVTYLPAEDPRIAVEHRLHALAPHISEEERRTVAERLTIWPLMGLQVDVMSKGWAAALERVATGSRLMVLDTLRRFHGEDENASGPMARLLSTLEGICERTGASILFLHHTAKGAALNGGSGEQQASRGSSVLVDNIRGGQWNLSGMSEAEARKLDIEPGERRRYVKLIQAKSNFGPPIADRWLERGAGGMLLPAHFEDHSDGSESLQPTRTTRSARPVRQGAAKGGNKRERHHG